MKIQGYAAMHLNVTLKPFQIQAIQAYYNKKDTLIVQATGSGKSACFHVPAVMLEEHQYGLVIVPTLALGEDHHLNLQNLKVESVFLNTMKSKEEFSFAFRKTQPLQERPYPAIIIGTPEVICGGPSDDGVLHLIDRRALKFIVIDETHLVEEWSNFRPSFGKIKLLKERFRGSPIIALTATLKPSYLNSVKNEILRDPVVIKGSIDRPNVTLKIASYRLLKVNKKAKTGEDEYNKWTAAASKIHSVTNGEMSIVYCAYAKDANILCSALLHLGVKAACYTGKDTRNDKSEIYKRMKEGDIIVLVATKAFGMGVNLSSIRHIVQMGLPESLSMWMQEFGRAGRDGNAAQAHLLVCDHVDFQRLTYWTKSLSQDEKNSRYVDFLSVVEFYSKASTGDCLRKYLLGHFDEIPVDCAIRNLSPEECCTGCVIRTTVPLKLIPEIKLLLQTLRFLLSNGLKRIYQTQIGSIIKTLIYITGILYFNANILKI